MFDYLQLKALLAVEEAGTFEGAARALNLSSFAVVQRIKTLEAKLGVALIERGPTRITEIGKVLCDHTNDVKQLELAVCAQFRTDNLDAGCSAPTLRIAVNDDSLSDWFLGTWGKRNGGAAGEKPRMQIQLANPDAAVDMMRTGKISAALTCSSVTAFGFKSYRLGPIVYRAVASPTYCHKYFSDGISPLALANAPCLRFCGNDMRSHEWIEKILGKAAGVASYRHPSSQGALRGCLAGEFWAMLPDHITGDHLISGALTELISDTPVRRNLYWHVTGSMVTTIRPVTRALFEKAGRVNRAGEVKKREVD